MNQSDFDAGQGPTNPEELRTAQLCAYLFDELDASERAELETALAADARLRAELESLRTTIGLVRREHAASAPLEPRLSATAMATLTAKAAGPKLSTVSHPLKRGTLLQGIFNNAGRLAAASLLVTGGTLAFLQNRSLDRDTQQARLAYDRSGVSPANGEHSSPLLYLSDTGYGGGKSSTSEKAEPASSLESQEVGIWTKRTGSNEVAKVALGEKTDLAGLVQAPSGSGGGSGGSYRGPGDRTPGLPSAGGPITPGSSAPARVGQANHPSLGVPFSQGVPALPFDTGTVSSNTPVTEAQAPPAESARARRELGTVAATRAPAPQAARKKAELTQQLEALGYGSSDDENEHAGPPSAGFFDDEGDGELSNSPRGGFSLPKASLDERARKLADQWIAHCQPGKNERPRDMYFRFWGDNPYVFSSQDALATFAADVDTASYALARRYLVDGMLPTKAQIRTEEFVNAFKPDVPAPAEGTFAITTELAPSPFGGSEARWMMRVTVRGKEVSREQRAPLAITFVVDTSGSMKEGQRLELVKHALRLLVSQLGAGDSIALVAFSNEARLILPMTSAAQRGVIEAAIFPLQPDGGTNAEAGLKLGYELAATGLATGVHNRVVFLSDGVANLGQTNQDQLSADVKHRRDQGIYLNTIGVGMGNHNDVFLERLADQGDGICDYVDDAAAVERAIVERFTGAFIPIASDVKIQVEFDPKRVLRWRQIGYENRAVADVDFRNDAVDAGEIGAGHQVTALFEIERVGSMTSNMIPDEGPLASVRLRWKEPKGAGKDPNEARVSEIEHTFFSKNSLGAFDSASAGYQRAVLVAQFCEVLRHSNHAQGDQYQRLISELQRVRSLPAWASDADTLELLALVTRAGKLGAGAVRQRGELADVLEEYRRHQYLGCQLNGMQGQVASEELKELQAVNDRLELRIRDLCLQELR